MGTRPPTCRAHTRSSATRAPHRATTRRDHLEPADQGYTLVELIVVVAILGVLGSVAWLGVTGMTTEAADTGCRADRRQLHVAAEAFFAQTGHDLIPPTGIDHDRYERTLVTEGFLDRPSTHHDLTDDGAVNQENPSC